MSRPIAGPSPHPRGGAADARTLPPGLPFDSGTTVRDILRRWPATRDVFERAGLMGCGGAQGPDEPLEFFANMHHVPLAPLMRSLHDAIGAQAGRPPRALAVAPASPLAFEPVHRYVPFLLWSVALTLTFGATLGAFNLARLTTPWFGGMTQGSVRAHAFVQVFGFVGLFVMGIACHVLPRFAARPLAASSAVRAMLGLQIGGLAAIVAAFMTVDEGIRWLWAGGSLALASAGAMFLVVVVRTTANAATPERFARWVIAGAAWQAIAACVSLAAAWQGDVAWLQVLWPIALWGFAGSWIFGIGRRIFPGFLGWRPRAARWEGAAFLTYQAAVALSAAAAWPADADLARVSAAGALGLVISVPLFSWCLGVRLRHAQHDVESGYQRFIVSAWIWLFVALTVGPLYTLAAALAGAPVPPLVTDFARHALGFGFVTQVMIGVATRVLPVFTGNALWSRRARTAAFYLLNASVALRALEAVVALGLLPAAWPFIAIAGVPALAAVVLFALNVVFTIHGRPASEPQASQPRTLADRRVSDILAIPGALDVLVEAGFTPLRNPVMRATFAAGVTLRQACTLRGVPLEPLLARLEARERPRGVIMLKPIG